MPLKYSLHFTVTLFYHFKFKIRITTAYTGTTEERERERERQRARESKRDCVTTLMGTMSGQYMGWKLNGDGAMVEVVVLKAWWWWWCTRWWWLYEDICWLPSTSQGWWNEWNVVCTFGGKQSSPSSGEFKPPPGGVEINTSLKQMESKKQPHMQKRKLKEIKMSCFKILGLDRYINVLLQCKETTWNYKLSVVNLFLLIWRS